MSTVKIKGSWNRQKGRLQSQLSNLIDNEDLLSAEEEILKNLVKENNKKGKKKNNFKKEVEW